LSPAGRSTCGYNGPYHGKHYQLDETLCVPAPVSSPRPRILIGGSGERKTLRLVATYADACNLFGDPDVVAHKIDVLRRHCDTVGRDPAAIEATALLGPVSPKTDVDMVVRRAESFAAVGVHTIMVGAVGKEPARWLEETIGPAVSRLRDVEAGG
jgi:alkanesulfonate monooxygenase SsuD/methylene tetrahydromethanopterin reductase-like flavin-dependent oxidoreductase (luciferase family)